MKKLLFVATSLYSFATPAFAIDVESRVDSAVVYTRGALITREAALTVPAGDQEIRLTNLPPGLGAADLTVTVRDPGVRLGQVRVTREPRSESYDDDYARAESAVQEQRLAVLAIDHANEAAERELTFLRGFAEGYARDAGVDGVRGTADPAAWRSALTLLREGTLEARARIRDNELARLRANQELQKRQSVLNALRGSARQRSIVTVSVSSPRAVDTTLSVSYFDEDAYWEPVYEARLDSNEGTLALAQIAEVWQETDEDWRGIALTLSTSEPAEELEPPELDERRLTLYDPTAERRKAANVAAVQELGRVGATADAYALQEVVVTGARSVAVDVGSYAVDYTIPGRVSVVNDANDAVTFELSATRTPVELLTTIVPAESTLAFLQSRFVYDGTLPLFASSMRIFVDGTFAGVSRMPSTLPGSEVTLPMGLDRRVDVQVRPQADDNDRRGVINRRRYETTHTLYEVTNRRPHRDAG